MKTNKLCMLIGKEERKIIIKKGKHQKTIAIVIGPGELVYIYKGDK